MPSNQGSRPQSAATLSSLIALNLQGPWACLPARSTLALTATHIAFRGLSPTSTSTSLISSKMSPDPVITVVAFNPFSSEPLKASLTKDDTSASTNPVE